jgi:hypothetical protein
MALLALMLMVVFQPAGAQDDALPEYTGEPVELRACRRSSQRAACGVHACHHAPDVADLRVANLTILNNPADGGANVASYSQALKTGRGTTWAGVLEVQDGTGRGGFFGLEIDAYTSGPSPAPGSMDGDRIGLGIILGRAFKTGPKATVDYGVFIAPAALDDNEADVNFGMMVWSHCRFACFAMRAGNKIAYEESGAIASKFDPHTGRWGLYNGDKPLFEVDVASGELRVNGRPVQVTFKD